ncbi:acetyltransferase [Alkalihalobacillus trypoxylicola]|uniref:Acetyltransferase n=1 Tax=Alkalihalobacillus trypoxylicola TaxID=519424 RepID=A0A161QFK7_9BACI|nr:acetyltransferase [Alkalihalobacillus trypoxylicola]KYG27659.1 acetyltransferase [Alkalihalobacillus trypoxylicola]
MKVVIIGAGGHSKVIQDMIRLNGKAKLIATLDDQFDRLIKRNGIYEGPIAAKDQFIKRHKQLKFVIGIGDNEIRRIMTKRLALEEERYVSIIHPRACVSSGASIANGTIIMPFAVINTGAIIGKHSIINTGAVIEHDNDLGDYVHISPRATLTGGVSVGEGTHIGAGAIVIPKIRIGSWAIVGAGSTVINDIPDRCTAVGIPAKVKKKGGEWLAQNR